MKNEELIRKWLADQLTEEEEKLLRETDEFAEMEKIWEGLSVATPPSYKVEEELERFHNTRHKQTKVIKVGWPQRFAGIAAAIVLISVIGFLLFRPSADTQTTVISEGMRPHYLPDSSEVILNKGSELTYEAVQWSSARRVQLKGEGFFQVQPGSTFEVVTSDGTVSVLGTSFNVKQRARFYEVICYEGKVRVKTSKQNPTLNAGDGYRKVTGDENRFQADVVDRPTWLDGKSSFFRTPYFVVLEELENQYNIEVETQNLDPESTFTGSFPNNNLDVALDAVTIPSGYFYQIKDNKLLITGDKN